MSKTVALSTWDLVTELQAKLGSVSQAAALPFLESNSRILLTNAVEALAGVRGRESDRREMRESWEVMHLDAEKKAPAMEPLSFSLTLSILITLILTGGPDRGA